MTQAGRGACYDGRTARRRDVAILLEPGGLRAVEEGEEVLLWPYEAIRREETTGDGLTIGSVDDALARIEIADAGLAAEIARRCPRLHARADADRAPVGRILLWSAAAAASILVTVVYLVPLAAGYAAALVPPAMERRLGDAVEGRVRALLGGGGTVCADEMGLRALDRLAEQLARAANLPEPPRIVVLPARTRNAVALPGGRIVLLDGMLQEARTPDEVAGVLAHEIGHVAHRDGLKRMIQVGGTGYLLGLLFGDVGGAGVLVALGQTLVDTSYSRGVEAEADAYAARLLAGLGRPAIPLGDLMARMEGEEGGGPAFLRTHPGGTLRRDALRGGPNPTDGAPLLTPEEWAALRRICASTRQA
ncbi:M48 family metallopeptidase [Salinarimonas soli]|uniref:M48 family metallopeptidase n=1 Tax=Salinarimonas soli TaxID=1638099 RepID=A0A5B2V2I6_9HYPH|nr:M48 family metallopeptidase [Salinarimonas soli]KAA2233146.1 M48 family metallopeptidase [Salinarimonas soli]